MKATTIDPVNITDFNRGTNKLQAFWLFCMFVAGKNSDYASRCLSRLLHAAKLGEEPPFNYFRSIGETGVHNALVASKVGQYGRLTKGIMQSLDLDLANCELKDLLAIHGVGNKTARFFLLHTREGCEYAVLDTHILSWLRDRGVHDVPDSTPTNNKEYKRLERAFRYLSRLAYPGLSDSQIDLLIWSGESGRLSGDEYFDMTHPFESRDGVDE
tara:strand:- start:6833 stop:7474 length:642 start_codon:yes stop_codon:yes gene_type:complete